MTTWIALFRGINVGGMNKIMMATLKSTMQAVKLQSVRTYIQSGNVVFESPLRSRKLLAKKILDSVESKTGFRPTLMLLTQAELERAMRDNPFEVAEAQRKTLNFFFLVETPKQPDLETIDKLAANSESHELSGSVFYLHAPNGIGRSKLAASVERLLGAPTTARNFNTVLKLSELASN